VESILNIVHTAHAQDGIKMVTHLNLACFCVSKSIYILRLKARVTRCCSLVLDKQKRFQLSSELAETVRQLQWSRQLVPKRRSSDIKRSVASSGPWYDACDGARQAEMATGLRRWLSGVWEIRRRASNLNISVASLKSTRRRTGSQCNSCRTGMFQCVPLTACMYAVAYWYMQAVRVLTD